MMSENEPLRLHLGGEEAKPGWKILNVQPGPAVDFVGDCSDLSAFADGSVDDIYASHVLEHLDYANKLPRALAEFHRVLKPGGRVRISVPDFDILCRLFIDAQPRLLDRIMIMRMVFGGQLDPYDFHYVGLSFDLLGDLLAKAGFSHFERVSEFGLFRDTSSMRFQDTLISLNLVVYKA
jgi:predicted SAM-dependent methyltransferase